MIIGGRARTTIIEIDISDRVPGFPGVYGCMVLDTKKGPYEPYLVTSDTDFLKRYTLYEKVQVGESLSLFEALFFLQKNNKLWVIRANNNAKHGGCLFSQDKPYNAVPVVFNSALFTVNFRSVTKAEQEIATILWNTVGTGETVTFSVDENSSTPDGIIKGEKYYLIPYEKSSFSYRLATSFENALAGVFVEFTGDFVGDVILSFGKDQINSEIVSGVIDPIQYQLNTSDGKPAGINSTFTVDLDNDKLNVSKQFYQSCATTDEFILEGQQKDIPNVAVGLPLTIGDSVYCIKVPQEGTNSDKFKIQIARTKFDAESNKYINFADNGGTFSLKFASKTNIEKIYKDQLDIVNDTITCSNGFYNMCSNNDRVKLSSSNGILPVVSGDELIDNHLYYILKGTNNRIQLLREKDGAPVNFTTDITDDSWYMTLTDTDKIISTNVTMDLSNDTLLVSEVFYENVQTGYSCRVQSDGTLPNGLKSFNQYFVIKTDIPQLIMLASTKDNAELGIPVDITNAGTIDTELGQYHTITDTHNTLYLGFAEKCLGIYSKTATSEDIYVTLLHYPYGTENTWSESDKVIARTLVEPFSFILTVYKKWEDGTITQLEKFLMSRKKDALDGTQTNIYCEEVAKRSSYITIVDNPNVSDEVYPCNQPTLLKLAKGTDGDTATTGDMILALNKIANRRKYTCTLIMDGGYSIPAYQQAIISLCETRQFTVGILSTPLNLELSANYLPDLLNYRNVSLNISSSFGAIYSPHLKVYDKYNNREIYVSPTGHVGGNISETGVNQELWYPVAGNRRGNLSVLGLSRVFEDADEDELYNNNINPIDFNISRGIRIWGQKTLLRRNSALDRLNVRLLLVVIEPAIQEFLDDFLFEFNDEITRTLVVAGITSYMESIRSRRGCYAYKVLCDETNNTPEVIDNNQLVVHLFIQPTKSAEYINCYIVITRTGASMSLEAVQA